KLEGELGVRLLERTSRVVSVTPAGAVFAELARKVLADFEVAVAEARRAGGASAFRIASLPHLPIELLLSFLDALSDRNLAYQPHVPHLPSLEQAGYHFRRMHDAGGMDGRDVTLAVAEGLGTGLEPFSLAEVAGAGGLVVRRHIDPPIRMPDTVVVWRADPPPQLRTVLADVRTV